MRQLPLSFFGGIEPDPEPAPARMTTPPRASWVKPRFSVPASLAVDVVLARNDDAAVVLADVRVFGNGLELLICQYRRRLDRAAERGRWTPDHLPGAEVRVGVLYPDGRKATSLRRPPNPYQELDPQAPVLTSEGGGGGP